MKRQTQGTFDRNLGDLAKGKSQSGSGRKYHGIDFKKDVFNTSAHVQPGERFYDFEEECWKRKKL